MADLLGDLLSAPVLFFALGVLAWVVRSDLDVPQPIPKLLSLYLLSAIGLKGGVGLSEAELTTEVAFGLGIGMLMSAAVPTWTFFLLKKRMGVDNAAGVAATYGSISAVTFIIAGSFLTSRGVSYGGHMVATMALMESPAIIVGILLAAFFSGNPNGGRIRWGALFHEAVFNGAVLLLLGSLLIGLLIGHDGFEELAPFFKTPFTGVLCLFLLDMGVVASRRARDLRRAGWFPIGFGLLSPPVHAGMGITLAYFCGLSAGDAMMLAVLCGSASYIAVPAAMRLSLPKANPSIFVPMALGITFPFNVIVGIPLYWAVISRVWSVS